MRWKTKEFLGYRVYNWFCLWPVSHGGTTYWLEWIKVHEKFESSYGDSYWMVYAIGECNENNSKNV